MNRIISVRGGRAPSRKHARSLQDLVRFPQLGLLLLELLDPGGGIGRDTGLGAGIDLVTALPQPQRLRAYPEQPGHVTDREHPQRPLTHLRRILPGHRVPSLLEERNESQADSPRLLPCALRKKRLALP